MSEYLYYSARQPQDFSSMDTYIQYLLATFVVLSVIAQGAAARVQ